MIPAEWPAQAADTIVETIGKVRDKTTKPAIVAARALVYGLLAAMVGLAAFALFLIGLVRVLSYLPGNIWTVYAGFAAVFVLGGILMLRKANRPATPAE
jgi:phage-related minor tail protein